MYTLKCIFTHRMNNPRKIKSLKSENGNPVTKLSESPAKRSNNSGRSKASILASLFFITLIGILSIILGLIFIEIHSSSKDLKYDSIKKETFQHHVKESESRRSEPKETLPPSSPPVKSETEIKMDDDKTKRSSDSPVETERLQKKQKIEGIVKKSKTPDTVLPINEDKVIEMEKQIIQDPSDKVYKNKESKITEKDESSKPSSSTGESKVDEKSEKTDGTISEGSKSEATLKELYIEVESLAEDILQEDPENSMVKELAPHLEGVLKDLEGGKLSGLRDSLLHIKLILSDLKERLEESKRLKKSDVNKPPKPDSEASENKDEKVNKPPKPDSEASKTKDEKVPVDEVIPDPVYIAPLGDTDENVRNKPSEKPPTSDNVSRVEAKATEEIKAQKQPKKSSKVDDAKVSQPSPIDKEKQQKSENKPQERKTESVSEKKVDQPSKDSGKDPELSKKTMHAEKSSENRQNVHVPKEESKILKDKIIDEKSNKIEKSPENKPSEAKTDKRKLPETENEVKVEKIEESPMDKKLKESQGKVKRETKSSTVEDLNQESDKKKLDVKQTEKLNENKEQKKTQKDAVKTPEQSSKQSVQQEKSADKSEENNIKLKDKASPPIKKIEDEKASEKQPKNEKISPKVNDAKSDTKESEAKEKSEEQKLKKSSEEAQTVDSTSKKVKQATNTDKEKKVEKAEGKSSTHTNANQKTSPETSHKTAKEVKSSEIDEKLKLASALEDENLIQALSMYDTLSQEMPKSPTVLYRRAVVLDKLSVEEKSNARLEQTIQAYLHLLTLSNELDISKDILKEAGLRCADRMNFRVLKKVGIFYLMMNRNEEAGLIFQRVLEISPDDGFALVHYGFVLKIQSKDESSLIQASNYLERGINSDAEGVHDVRMYYHLGDALQRLGQNEKAYQVFDDGVKRGLFLSRYQRSTMNVQNLKGKPLWTPEETTYEALLQEKENLREKGSWKQLELFARGEKHTENCKLTPFTCSLIEEFKPAAGCKSGQSKFSVMDPGTHVFPHTGPTNHRLRSHLGLVTPEGARIRILNDTLTWEEGKLIIFDDSFEHEVWNDGNSFRLILIIDVWHPELTTNEIKMLRPI
ncbi:Aspartyl/asparaginyl beta-hydroxylase [Armadillidium nasatum]|uniref:Aspartyl/asparaginyl beta-hydroxylase n=1 Tax=Armadillidium nasatum TaxID=96803 RepID=A0A5N5SJS4_9CRUS|nr:Aspartyl/asparaginyl beta-hydroxylase [Armadillidium nasatum]